MLGSGVWRATGSIAISLSVRTGLSLDRDDHRGLGIWGREEDQLVNREESYGDVSSRRPSHADKRRPWRRELLVDDIRRVLRPGVTAGEIQAVAERLLALAA
jgi:hypothetical protein